MKRSYPYFVQPLWSIGICYLFVILPCMVNAQSLHFKNYTGEDVLPSSNIYAAFQDSKGFMWFGTDRGVTRFDGYTFTNFTLKDGLSDKEVFDFFEDSRGRVWFETMNGKVSYYLDGDFFNAGNDSTLAPLDSKSYISMMREDTQHNIWITTVADGIICYHHDGTITRFFAENNFVKVHGLFFRRNEQEINLLTQEGTYYVRFNAELDSVIALEFTNVGKKVDANRMYRINDPYPRFLALGDQDILYKDYAQLYHCDLSKNTFDVPFVVDDGVNIHSLSHDDENLWIGTTHGALLYTPKENKVLRKVLTKNMITDVVKDLEGNYWFTTYGDGIFFSTSLEMFGFTSENGLVADKVTCLAKDPQNRVWIGYGRGKEDYVGGAISYIDGKKVKKVVLSEQAYFNKLITRNIFFGYGHCWLATSQGVMLMEKENRDALLVYGRYVVEREKDEIWFGAGENLYRIKRSDFEKVKIDLRTNRVNEFSRVHQATLHFLSRPNHVKKMYVDSDKKLWITSDSEVLRLEDEKLQIVPSSKLGVTVTINDMEMLPDKTMVMATGGEGVTFYKNDRVIKSIREDEGLSANICNAISIDDEGTIWVATNNGLNKITGYPDRIAVDYLNVYDGILSNEVSDVLVSGDTVWVGTNKGLNFFHRKYIQKKKMSPRVYIESITVRGIPIRKKEDLIFGYRQNDIGIKYTGLLFNNGEPLVYRYKLHPSDPWRFTKSTSVYLPELRPDEYEFMVEASGHSGHWSKVARIKFEIRGPFWKSALFITFMVLMTIAIISAAVYRHFKQQKKEIQRQHRVTLSELKSLRAQMNPHFLFNALNSIQGVLLKQNIEVTQDYLGRFGKLMRTILDHADKSSITIAEELESITNYLEIEQLRAKQFQYEIVIDPTLDVYTREIPAMIIQPFIENSIWHGFAHQADDNRLLIKFTDTPVGETVIEITDNGIGRKKALSLRSSKHKSKGIQLVKERIDLLNYKAERKIRLEVIDLEDEHGNHPGTKVIIVIPYL
jgi:ligand-binding sensor domain-containing protein